MGIALSGGIVVVYFLTMFMVPNLTLLLDLEKPKHPPLAAFNVMVEVPVRRSSWVLGVFFVFILISATVGQANVEGNIDLLGMAPEDEQSVIKMKQYSDEFNAGQVGMVLVRANVTGNINDDDTSNDDPAEILEQIEVLEAKINEVDNASAVSIVFLMKATGVAVSITGAPIAEFIDETPGIPDEIKDTATSLLNQEIIADASFWDVLTNPSQYNMPVIVNPRFSCSTSFTRPSRKKRSRSLSTRTTTGPSSWWTCRSSLWLTPPSALMKSTSKPRPSQVRKASMRRTSPAWPRPPSK